jgi:hypothetical protein
MGGRFPGRPPRSAGRGQVRSLLVTYVRSPVLPSVFGRQILGVAAPPTRTALKLPAVGRIEVDTSSVGTVGEAKTNPRR